jgi:DNA-binding transcriptional regulator GbsR (MarR family)
MVFRTDRHEVSSPAAQHSSQNGRNGLLQSTARRDLIESAGALFQMLGLPRSVGQIYGLLYLSKGPLSLDDIAASLSISKGSASIGTRQLAAWGAIRQVWVLGERRDHFEAVGDLAQLLRGSYGEFIKPRLESSHKRLQSIFASLEVDVEKGILSRTEHKFCTERLRSLERLRKRVEKIVPLAERLVR